MTPQPHPTPSMTAGSKRTSAEWAAMVASNRRGGKPSTIDCRRGSAAASMLGSQGAQGMLQLADRSSSIGAAPQSVMHFVRVVSI